MATIVQPANDAIPASLVDESAPPEEVNDEIGFSFIQGNDEIYEVENGEDDEGGGSGIMVMKQMNLKKICICLMMMTMTLMTMRMLMIEWLRILMCLSSSHVKQLFGTLLMLYECVLQNLCHLHTDYDV